MDSAPQRRKDAKEELLEAAKRVLLKHGYVGLSTRAVAAEAGTQMSQIRYHFESKEGMVLALFAYMNASLIDRQTATFHRSDMRVSQKWALACDYLEADLASGYVRVLQELTAVGWSNPAVGNEVRRAITQWQALILDLVRDVEDRIGSLGPFGAEEIAVLVGASFLGAEALILLGFDDAQHPILAALRRVGDLIAMTETIQED